MISVRLDQVASLFSEGIEEQQPTLADRRRRRQALLRESPGGRVRRIAFAAAHALANGRLPALRGLVACMIRERRADRRGSADRSAAPARSYGLCGLARPLTPASLLEAYSLGLALHAPLGPAAWWSAPQRWAKTPGEDAEAARRCLCGLAECGAAASLDTSFDEVVAACARPDWRAPRLGFGPKIMRVFAELFDAGLAHSVEIRDRRGDLVAGAFGVAVGRVFITESCFGPPDLAAAAVAALDRQLCLNGFVLHEARLGAAPGWPPSQALRALGFAVLPCEAFADRVRANLCGSKAGRWRLAARGDAAPDEALAEAAAKEQASASPRRLASAA